MSEDKAQWEGKIFASEPQSSVPPLSSTSCTLEDRGTTYPHISLTEQIEFFLMQYTMMSQWHTVIWPSYSLLSFSSIILICFVYIGNATARFIRCTSYNFPVEAQSAQQSHLPLAAILCPLARPENEEVCMCALTWIYSWIHSEKTACSYVYFLFKSYTLKWTWINKNSWIFYWFEFGKVPNLEFLSRSN